MIKNVQAAAHTLGLKLQVLYASAEHDFDTASVRQLRAGALVIGTDQFFIRSSSRCWRLATRCPRSSSIASSPRPAAWQVISRHARTFIAAEHPSQLRCG
jgi:hypothetical protein